MNWIKNISLFPYSAMELYKWNADKSKNGSENSIIIISYDAKFLFHLVVSVIILLCSCVPFYGKIG